MSGKNCDDEMFELWRINHIVLQKALEKLRQEQEQGISIDRAARFFERQKRIPDKYIEK